MILLIGATAIRQALLAVMRILAQDNASTHVLRHARGMGHAIRHVQTLIPQAFARLVIHVTMLVFAAIPAIKIASTLTGVIVMPQDQLAAPQTHVLLIA